MECVILVGIPGAGKSTFYRTRFFETHVRISRDMLKSRERERMLMRTCLLMKQPFVIDNTNLLRDERAWFIGEAAQAGFRVLAYFFVPDLRGSMGRNLHRERKVPRPAVLRAYKQLQAPGGDEGFDEIFTVRPAQGETFEVSALLVKPELPQP